MRIITLWAPPPTLWGPWGTGNGAFSSDRVCCWHTLSARGRYGLSFHGGWWCFVFIACLDAGSLGSIARTWVLSVRKHSSWLAGKGTCYEAWQSELVVHWYPHVCAMGNACVYTQAHVCMHTCTYIYTPEQTDKNHHSSRIKANKNKIKGFFRLTQILCFNVDVASWCFYSNRPEKVMNQDNFQVHWWEH